MAYIKSHSNYVIKEKHQLTNDGTILERDMATVGGLNKFALGQFPVYQSGNFVITVNTDESSTKDYTSNKWEKNDNNDVWTLEDIENISKTEQHNTNEIVLKKDFYRLRDFAYYGSCSELIRASVTDIIRRFPGELYAPIINDNGINVYFTNLGKTEILGNEKLFLVDNPFNIQLHVSNINIGYEDDELKFLCNDLYDNYEIINDENGSKTQIYSIYWDNYICYDGEHILFNDALNKSDYDPQKVGPLGIGQMISQITINDSIVIYAFNGNYGNIVYLTEKHNLGIHIRPKEEFYNKFFSSLDVFQNVLLNRKTTPQYTASFEIMKENSFGYETRIKKFTFPKTYGGYNLSTSDNMFNSYLSELVNASLFYDEKFCDNLFRNMTHESIKNFDWTYTKDLDEDETEENIIGGSKIQKFIRLMGREFDEIKFYIDNIANSNNITYDNKNNLADYFLTDVLNNDGWEIKNIHPIKCTHDHSETFVPYSFTERMNNYFCLRKCDGTYTYEEAKTNSREKVDDSGVLRHRISHYISNKEYTINEVNNHFMKMLKLNSRNILRHKGTIEGIEMILGLFGLKSKSYFDLLKDNDRFEDYLNDYDYAITEYTSFSTPINDTNGEIDKYNRKKTINYGSSYTEYQGLMVRPSETNGNIYLYPYFSPNKSYDGNPYYQMNGGWMKIKDKFTETVRNIKHVDAIDDLAKTHYGNLSNGEIYFVKYLNDDKLLVDGIIYNINTEYLNGKNYRYISAYSSYNSVKIGQTSYSDYLNVSSYDNTEKYINLYDLEYNSEIRIYLDDKNKIICYQDDESKNINHTYLNAKEKGKTNYFKIINKNHKTQISDEGWKRISESDSEYKSINTIENKFYGNNPHKGNFKYDDGKDYIMHFVELFKYAIENEEFDERKFNGRLDYLNSLEEMKHKGFKYLMDSNNCDYNIYDDKKLHYFCDYIGEDGYEYHYDDNDELTDEENSYSLLNKKEYEIHKTSNSGNVDQIVNIKRVDLQFNHSSDEFKCYIEDVVLEYLEQVIPSNVILHVNYGEDNEIHYHDFDTYYSSYEGIRHEINDSNQCNAKTGVISFFKPLGKFAFITTEGRQDTESNCVLYPNLPLVTTPQAEFNINFEQYIYPQSVNNIYRAYDKNTNSYKFYKWNHSGDDLEEVI